MVASRLRILSIRPKIRLMSVIIDERFPSHETAYSASFYVEACGKHTTLLISDLAFQPGISADLEREWAHVRKEYT